jgi:hypothetical protein
LGSRKALIRPSPAAVVAAAGTALQIAQWLRARPLWVDEEMIALNLRDRTLPALAGPLWLGQSAPLGWLGGERVVLLLFGARDVALRALPVLFGVATVVAAWRIGRRSMGAVGAAALVLLASAGSWLTFNFFELKPYSADAFFGLTLPALAAWAAEPVDPRGPQPRRALAWWVVAAVSQWFGNGGLLVTPFCALVILAAFWKRGGRGALTQAALPAAVWAALFAAHFWLAMRFTWTSTFLHDYWAWAMPAAGASVAERVRWIGAQIAPFGVKPGGTDLPLVLWAVAAAGWILADRVDVVLRLAFASVPLAGFALAALRLVPLFERLSLWMVPSLYVGVALAVDAAARARPDAAVPRRAIRFFAQIVAAIAALIVCADVTVAGAASIRRQRPRASNHLLDDRSAVGWLTARRARGDVYLTTQLALPAVWWYGGISVGPPANGSRAADGTPVLRISLAPPGADCDRDALQRALAPYARALVYFGFRFDDVPPWFDDFLMARLGAFSTMTFYKGFAERSRAAVFDLQRSPAGSDGASARLDAASAARIGCLEVSPAKRW